MQCDISRMGPALYLEDEEDEDELYNASPKVRGPSPKEIGAKHAKFGAILDKTTSDFDREYLRNGSKYPKSERHHVIISDSSCVQRKKSGELWSTNYRKLYEFEPTQIAFFGRLYYGP